MRRDGPAPVEDAWGRTYFRQLEPGTMYCSYHRKPHPRLDFSPSARESGHSSSWCTEAHRVAQKERRRRR